MRIYKEIKFLLPKIQDNDTTNISNWELIKKLNFYQLKYKTMI